MFVRGSGQEKAPRWPVRRWLAWIWIGWLAHPQWDRGCWERGGRCSVAKSRWTSRFVVGEGHQNHRLLSQIVLLPSP